MSRQFSEDEARRIFARAADRQHAAAPTGGSLSLDDLQAIGREAGIEPSHIAAAVAESDVPAAPTWLGSPLRHRTVRRLDGPVSDAAWGRIVDHLRMHHPSADTVEEIGDRQIWTSNPGMPGYGARVTVAPDGDGALLTVESKRAPEDAFFYTMSAVTGMMGTIGLLAWLAKGKPAGLVMLLMMLAVFATTMAGSVWSLRRRAKNAPRETDRLADTLARMATPVAPAVPADEIENAPTSSPSVSLDALGEAPDATPGNTRRRVRG